MQTLALFDDIADAQRGEHPVLDRVLAQDVVVADEILVVFLVALDIETEDFFDGDAVAVEGGARQGNALTHVGLLPALVDFCQSNGMGFVDGVDQPDVFLELGIDCHRI